MATNTYADQSVTYNQASPATPGSYLTFFITGEGQMTTPWADRMLPAAPLFPNPAAPINVSMVEFPASVPETGRD